MTSQEFAARYSSKVEVYRFLASEVGAYLPEYGVVTVLHLRDLAAGKRKLILCKDAKQIHVPQFEDLDKEDMLAFAAAYPEVARALPSEEREVKKLHRSYIANVIHTLVGEPFRQWVEINMAARNRKIEVDQNLMIEMDAEVLRAFQASTSISGKSGHHPVNPFFPL